MFSTLRPERMRAITVFRDRSFRGTGREDSELWAKSHGSFTARRWIQSMDLHQAWKTPWKGLAHPYRLQPTPGCHQDSGAFCLSGKTITSNHMTIENHSFPLRPESVATWFDSGRLRCSGVVRRTIQYSHLCPNLSWRVFVRQRMGLDRDPTFNQESFRPQEFALWIWCC